MELTIEQHNAVLDKAITLLPVSIGMCSAMSMAVSEVMQLNPYNDAIKIDGIIKVNFPHFDQLHFIKFIGEEHHELLDVAVTKIDSAYWFNLSNGYIRARFFNRLKR